MLKTFGHNRSNRSSHRRCSVRKSFLRNFTKFTGKHLWQSVFFNKVPGLRPATLIKKETLAQVFSYKFRKVSKDTFLQNTSGLNGATKDKLREKICLRLSLKFLQLRWWRRKLCLLYKLSSTLSNLDYGLLVYMYSACWKFRSTLLFRK